MALCDNCMFFKASYDEFRKNYDDIIDQNKTENHFCPMYDDHIPYKIFNENGDCPYYSKK